MITRETDYALRTALYLAKCEAGSGVVSTAALAEAMSIPYRFLRKIVSKLVAADLLDSRRGKGGGLALARPACEITLLHIIQAVDPESIMLNLCSQGIGSCDRSRLCGIRREFDGIQRTLNDGLNGVTLASVASCDGHAL